MDEYDALVTNERIKSIFLVYYILKMNLTPYIDVTTRSQDSDSIYIYMYYFWYTSNGIP